MAKHPAMRNQPGAAQTGPNWLDRAIAYVAPRQAMQRHAARQALALTGGYNGARIDKAQLSRWMPYAGSATTDQSGDLPSLRARSRDQMRNTPVALGALNTNVSHVIGTGLSYSPAPDVAFLGLSPEEAEAWKADTKRRWETWAHSADCDLTRQCDFYGLQELAYRSYKESGDVFCITPRAKRPGKPARLALQLVEADRICNPNLTANTETLIDGIQINAETGEAIAIQIAAQHPGGIQYNGASNTWSPISMRGSQTGRRNVLHIFKPLRPGQVRGVPWIAPILEPLKQLDRWSEAELNAAVIGALDVTFVKMDPTAFETLYDEEAQTEIAARGSAWSGEKTSGRAINLLPGESIDSPAPGRPNPAFDPFWTAMVRQIGIALDMPFEVLVMHFQSSYSAARAAMLMAWKAFRSQRDLFTKQFCQPVFELWLSDEIAEGRINAPGYFADEVIRAAWCKAIWTGDGPGSIDPEKEVNAAQKRVDLGISTKQAESIAFDGVDWEQKHQQRVKEINAEKEAGIYFPPAGTPVQPAQGAKGKNGADTDADTTEALQKLGHQIQALANEPRHITVTTPPVEMRAGDIHIAPAAVTVQSGDVQVNLPEGCIQLEATIQAPAVQVEVPPAQIIVQQTPRQASRQTISYGADGSVQHTSEPLPPITH